MAFFVPLDRRDQLVALDELRCLGVDFLSLREQVDTSTPMGRAVFTIIAAISELERETTRERVIAGSDCGFATFASRPAVDPDIAWAKLAAMVEGAAIASDQLW